MKLTELKTKSSSSLSLNDKSYVIIPYSHSLQAVAASTTNKQNQTSTETKTVLFRRGKSYSPIPAHIKENKINATTQKSISLFMNSNYKNLFVENF